METRSILPKIIWIVVILAVITAGVYLYLTYAKAYVAQRKEKIAYYEAVGENFLSWMDRTVLSNGAIAKSPATGEKTLSVNPYFACITATVFIESGEEAYIQNAKNYFDWHFAHLNTKTPDANGLYYTIYDYYADTNEAVVTKEYTEQDYDSTDSYAALFLSALASYYDQTGDDAYILNHEKEVLGLLQVIEKTTVEGLTYAKPDYPVYYLMDNIEVLQGLKGAQLLFERALLPNSVNGGKLQAVYEKLIGDIDFMQAEIEQTLWDGQEGHYYHSFQMQGQIICYSPFSWEEFYPDATSQLFPITAEPMDHEKTERYRTLYDIFCSHYDWQTVSHVKGEEDHFYWGIIAYCAALLDDEARLEEYLDNVQMDLLSSDTKRLYNADAAWMAKACQTMVKRYDKQIKSMDPFGLFY